jgi:hypothetical protein
VPHRRGPDGLPHRHRSVSVNSRTMSVLHITTLPSSVIKLETTPTDHRRSTHNTIPPPDPTAPQI